MQIFKGRYLMGRVREQWSEVGDSSLITFRSRALYSINATLRTTIFVRNVLYSQNANGVQ